jgi:general stress protein 26
MRRKRYCVITTLGAGEICARVVQPFPPDTELRIWFGTSPRSRKVTQLRTSDRATLVYADDARNACVVLIGRARIVDELSVRRRRFMPFWWAFFPRGPDHDFVAIRFEPERVELLDFTHRITPAPFGLASVAVERRDGRWALA